MRRTICCDGYKTHVNCDLNTSACILQLEPLEDLCRNTGGKAAVRVVARFGVICAGGRMSGPEMWPNYARIFWMEDMHDLSS